MKLFLLSFILIGMVATTTAAEPRHHRDEPQDHDVDGGRVFGRSMSKRQDAVGETKKTIRAARGHRHRYVEGLTTVVKPDGRLFLLCFSDDEPGTQGPRRGSPEK